MILDQVALVITGIFFLVVLSYYVLLFIRTPAPPKERAFSSITIIIPARNEARHIADCIASVKAAAFAGKKQIIVVDDASADRTAAIAKGAGVLVLRNPVHRGKAYSMNRALARATGQLVAVVDA